MNNADLRVRKLQNDETVRLFDCGDPDLNDFIANEAPHYRNALLAVTYVLESPNEVMPLAYFSLANDRISLSDFANKTEFNRFRKHKFVNEKRLKSYPAAKLCRLAVGLSARKMHLGSFLLDFIKAFFLMDNKTGCRFITVDAYISAVPFYEKNGFFQLVPDDDNEHTRLLYFDLADYQENLAE